MQREICKKLEEIKEINPINYDKINRVLRFLYKTVQCDYFEKKINMSKLSEEIYHAAHIGGSSVLQQEVTSHVNLKETLFNNYIESKKIMLRKRKNNLSRTFFSCNMILMHIKYNIIKIFRKNADFLVMSQFEHYNTYVVKKNILGCSQEVRHGTSRISIRYYTRWEMQVRILYSWP